MDFSERAFLDCQRLLQQVVGLSEAILMNQRAGEDRQVGGRLGIVLAVPRLDDVQRLPVVSFGIGVMPEIEPDGAEVDQDIGHARVAVAIDLAVHAEHALVDRFGSLVMAGIEIGAR